VTAPEQLHVTDEDVDADRVLAEIERLGILVRDPVVLDQAGGSLIDQGDVAVRRVAALDRLAVVRDLRIRIRRLRPVVPPAFDVRLKEPSADETEIVLAQRRERVRARRASSTAADGRRLRRPVVPAST
jgi:hypothetical protein